MKAAIFYGPNNIRIEEKELRELKDNEVLVKVEACGVCGTDIHIFEGTANSNPPVILGHEYDGVVDSVGGKVKDFKHGDRVVIDPNIACGLCHYCLSGKPHLCEKLTALGVHTDGGFAGFSIVPESQLYHLPDNIPFDFGCLTEPISCAIHGVDLADIKAGDNVVIIGAGAVGLVMIQLVRLCSADRIFVVEPTKERREIALRLNADIMIDPTSEDLRDIVFKNTYDGADVIIECAGVQRAASTALGLVKRGGTIIFFGVCEKEVTIDVKPQEIYFKELTIRGSYINPQTFGRAIELLCNDKIDLRVFSIKKFSLDDLVKAFFLHKEHRYVKNIITPNL